MLCICTTWKATGTATGKQSTEPEHSTQESKAKHSTQESKAKHLQQSTAPEKQPRDSHRESTTGKAPQGQPQGKKPQWKQQDSTISRNFVQYHKCCARMLTIVQHVAKHLQRSTYSEAKPQASQATKTRYLHKSTKYCARMQTSNEAYAS